MLNTNHAAFWSSSPSAEENHYTQFGFIYFYFMHFEMILYSEKHFRNVINNVLLLIFSLRSLHCFVGILEAEPLTVTFHDAK